MEQLTRVSAWLCALAIGCGGSTPIDGPDAGTACEPGEVLVAGSCEPAYHLRIKMVDFIAGPMRAQQFSAAWEQAGEAPTGATTVRVDGPCKVTEWVKNVDGPALPQKCADVGNIIVSGAVGPIALDNTCDGDASFPDIGIATTADGTAGDASLTFLITGGDHFPASTESFEAPKLVGEVLSDLTLGEDYPATWRPGNGDEVIIEVSNSWPHEDIGRTVSCTVSDDGSFVIPGFLTAMLPTYAAPSARISRVIRRKRAVSDAWASATISYSGASFRY